MPDVNTDPRRADLASHESDLNRGKQAGHRVIPGMAATVTAGGAQQGRAAPEVNNPDFPHIKDVCQNEKLVCQVDITPAAFQKHRMDAWPQSDFGEAHLPLASIYEAVRKTGLPNALHSKIQLPTNLNIPSWEKYLENVDDNLLSYIKYGFPMGYLGPQTDTVGIQNHPSARDFAPQVDKFIAKELALGGIIGPFNYPPFQEWAHVSPLMTRPKASYDDRRVITDLTFPANSSVNAYIKKNTVMGLTQSHCLPSVDAAVNAIKAAGPDPYLFTVDVSRAYKNFKSCPLDWPLLGLSWGDAFYLDLTMPFGARASSAHMQKVADAIVRILDKKGVKALMYLDDIFVVSDSRDKAIQNYAIVRALLDELGLPEAVDKAQPPAKVVRWLGIDIDALHGTISVPPEKLNDIIKLSTTYLTRRAITRKQLQSLLGKLLHIAKCIAPARLFVARLLEALRGHPKQFININSSMKSDILWFRDFAKTWNGVSVFGQDNPTEVIVVDACLTGIGGASGKAAYAYQVADLSDPIANISELEAINVAVALQTFVSVADRGKCFLVYCDNMPTVNVLRSGRGHNPVILEAARAAWMVQALFQVKILYEHIPGHLNTFADALSRAHLSHEYATMASDFVDQFHLKWVPPSTHPLTIVSHIMKSRSKIEKVGRSRRDQTDDGPGSGDERQQGLGREDVLQVLPPSPDKTCRDSAASYMHLHRKSQRGALSTTNHQEPYRRHQDPLPSHGIPPGSRSPESSVGDGGHSEAKGLHIQGPTYDSHTCCQTGDQRPPNKCGYPICQSSNSDNILCCPSTVRGCTTIGQGLRPSQTLDKGRRHHYRHWPERKSEGRKEPAEVQPIKACGHPESCSTPILSSNSCTESPRDIPNFVLGPAHVCLPRDIKTDPRLLSEAAVESCTRGSWTPSIRLHHTWPS